MLKSNPIQCISYQAQDVSALTMKMGMALLLALCLAVLSPSLHSAFAADFSSAEDSENISPLPTLREFVVTIKTGDPKALVGVYVSDVLALPIVQQPVDAPGYVSSTPGVATQFRMAKDYGTDALLAHNFLSGELFFDLKAGQRVVLVFGDGRVRFYEVKELNSYQALSPNSPYSNFVDLASPDKILSAADVFLKNFGAGSQLVFQTCIEAAGVQSWGRLFVKAEPIRRTIALGKWGTHF